MNRILTPTAAAIVLATTATPSFAEGILGCPNGRACTVLKEPWPVEQMTIFMETLELGATLEEDNKDVELIEIDGKLYVPAGVPIIIG